MARKLAPQIGPSGKLYAQEVSPHFLDLLRDIKTKEKVSNMEIVEGNMKDIGLTTEGSCDMALVCDVYHHFEYPISSCR
jgi:ubiquinone/menaquinone biosynthesis C-methylase UbiE